MAAAIETLLREPERAILMARRARDELARYTWPHVGRQWPEVYAGRAA